MTKTNSPTQILVAEHEIILRVIGAITKECHALKNERKNLDKKFFVSSIDFVRNYADKFHHAKEKDILFVEFCKNAHLAHCNPIEQMLYEHRLGREFIQNLEQGIKNNDKNKAIENGLGYAALLEEHIYKENNILYPMADEILSDKAQKEMLRKFSEAERKNFKDGEIKKYLAFAKDISKKSK